MRRLLVLALTPVLVLAVAAPALACGGLIGPNGTVSLGRTTTLAGYHDGVEHYVTSFTFEGAGGAFGSLVPLPGVPSDVQRGGDWTLQRLVRETRPQPRFAAQASAAGDAAPKSAQVILQTRIDALDITVLKGGGASVGKWAADNGFRLPPDGPEILDFYARRSPVFLAARFDADAARSRGLAQGQGTPIHVSIPTPDPWVPLRILALGKQATEFVQADVYLLTDDRPALLPAGDPGIDVARNEPASPLLLSDLRADKGMSWIATSMWLTYLRLDVPAALLRYDLAVDAHGTGHPSPVAAGLSSLPVPYPSPGATRSLVLVVLAALLVVAGSGWLGRRTLARPA
ncbi:MAG: hypothetical protein JWP02_3656 [Acidimicrobiales bacterium]|nr:hypothetical protein [Acidimicrobiales bacterium]